MQEITDAERVRKLKDFGRCQRLRVEWTPLLSPVCFLWGFHQRDKDEGQLPGVKLLEDR
jgi:hypothetical protein